MSEENKDDVCPECGNDLMKVEHDEDCVMKVEDEIDAEVESLQD